jgi:23S rRNA pseudouridine1911/1915/1917 synthase
MARAAKLVVLYEDNHLLAVEKPAGLPTQGAPAGQPSLVTLAKQYVKHKYAKPGNVYLGVVSRLDTPVSGVVILARTSKAAKRLNEQFGSRTVRKVYWAVVEGTPKPAEAECTDWIWHDERHRRMQIVKNPIPGAQESKLFYRRLQATGGGWLVEVELLTGRKHQIRVQLACRGWPIVGDRQYGSLCKFAAGIALHARQLEIAHPVKGGVLKLVSQVPNSWSVFGDLKPGHDG